MDDAHPYRGHYISWRAYEHQHEKKDADWFWALGVIAVSAALTAILFSNVIFAVLIIVAAVTLGIIATREPEIADFVISDKGLTAGDMFYAYDDIRAFWVEEDRDEPTLLVDTLKFMSPHLVIPLKGTDPEEVRDMLREFTHEEELVEPFSHKIMELLGF